MPLKLTVQTVEVGELNIYVNGEILGYAHKMVRFHNRGKGTTERYWNVELFGSTGTEYDVVDELEFKSISELRAGLRQRLEEKGPWWVGKPKE